MNFPGKSHQSRSSRLYNCIFDEGTVHGSLVSGGDACARVGEGDDGVGGAGARRPHERLSAVVVLHVDADAVAEEATEH